MRFFLLWKYSKSWKPCSEGKQHCHVDDQQKAWDDLIREEITDLSHTRRFVVSGQRSSNSPRHGFQSGDMNPLGGHDGNLKTEKVCSEGVKNVLGGN